MMDLSKAQEELLAAVVEAVTELDDQSCRLLVPVVGVLLQMDRRPLVQAVR